MKRRQPDFSRQSERLQSYLDSLTRTVGHADRVVPHRSLRLPGAGAVPFSPSARFAANAGSEPPSSLTPCAKQLRAPRLCRCEPNGIIPARSPPLGARLQPTWPAPCPDAPAACEISYNTVVLAATLIDPTAGLRMPIMVETISGLPNLRRKPNATYKFLEARVGA